MISRRRWGYVVWAVALGFVFVPEILAAIPLTESQLPFPTISRMTGHLEYEHAEWEIAPTLLIVVALYSLWRVPPHRQSAHRTPGGRLTFREQAQAPSTDDTPVRSLWFAVRVVAAALVIAAVTLWAFHHWPNQYVTNADGTRSKLPNFHVAYFLYGSIALSGSRSRPHGASRRERTPSSRLSSAPSRTSSKRSDGTVRSAGRSPGRSRSSSCGEWSSSCST